MFSFLRELQKRDRCASIVWLHDGLWVDKDLSNSIIHSAERIAARVVFISLRTGLAESVTYSCTYAQTSSPLGSSRRVASPLLSFSGLIDRRRSYLPLSHD